MEQFASPSGSSPLPTGPSPATRQMLKLGRLAKIGVPVVAVVGLGYGISTFMEAQNHAQQQSLQEQERLRKNAMLMEAYGDKSSLEDMQRAMEHYHKN
ncbi:uncharacterized protein TRUGW13939_05885 [Talaromyces rugulosus]|uniref:Uncharacterized protein n=1 Tax=Talaromyces rugulosus TaxID=121627 RepID=A0A7H8QYJ4_TALRU|nr:uncharacterized protein TRUGW13939_05885 [Talaromyces rugulosus]QKX58758.1 hypothetical protein TRUGW13939_05885 [Talaromyces rugulosus]